MILQTIYMIMDYQCLVTNLLKKLKILWEYFFNSLGFFQQNVELILTTNNVYMVWKELKGH